MSVALQGRIYDIQFLDKKKSLFWSLLIPHEVWAWSFATLCIYSKLSAIMSISDLQDRTPDNHY